MLQKLHTEDFDQVYSIMDASFPVDEHRPYDEQKALLEHPNYSIYVLPDTQNKNLKAFISVWQFDDFVYVEHFAVHPSCRNQGLGALMLGELHAAFSSQICLEVELPETDFARRRIGFYERNGFSINEYPYIQPPISKNRNAIPLLIMTTNGSISKDRFEEIRSTLYREVYKVSPDTKY